MTAQADPQVDTQVWEPDPDREGFIRLARVKTIREVYDEVIAVTGRKGPGHGGYFAVASGWSGPVEPWPAGRTVCYATTGGNEGHYVHADVIDDAGRARAVLVAKTFDGWDAAWDFAKRLAGILGA